MIQPFFNGKISLLQLARFCESLGIELIIEDGLVTGTVAKEGSDKDETDVAQAV